MIDQKLPPQKNNNNNKQNKQQQKTNKQQQQNKKTKKTQQQQKKTHSYIRPLTMTRGPDILRPLTINLRPLYLTFCPRGPSQRLPTAYHREAIDVSARH